MGMTGGVDAFDPTVLFTSSDQQEVHMLFVGVGQHGSECFL